MEYAGSIRINTNINPNNIPNYEINQESIKRLAETVARMGEIIDDYYNPKRLKQSMETLRMMMEDSFGELSSLFKQYNYSDMLKILNYSFSEVAETIGLKQMEALQNIDFSRLFRDSFYREKYDEVSQMAYGYVQEEVKGEENISQKELREIFNEQIEDKAGWQEKLQSKPKEFKEKYSVFYKFIRWFFIVLIEAIVEYFLDLGIPYIHGKIVSAPKENAPAIYYFDQRTEINIIGETDNYYFITYTDDDGNEVTGYGEKENIEIVPKDDKEVESESE